jgi:hypothetical protein
MYPTFDRIGRTILSLVTSWSSCANVNETPENLPLHLLLETLTTIDPDFSESILPFDVVRQ